MAEFRDCVVVKSIERMGIAYIDTTEDDYATFGPWVTNIAELADYLISSFGKLILASCAEKHARTRNRKETPQLETNTQTSSGYDRGATFMQSR
jgi:hypothetical protein